MGEYATFKGRHIKIGTCEQMYYLRADQVCMIDAANNSVDPSNEQHAGSIRFRFPFPDEDNIEPGSFQDYDRAHAINGVEIPEDVDFPSLEPVIGFISFFIPYSFITENLSSLSFPITSLFTNTSTS